MFGAAQGGLDALQQDRRRGLSQALLQRLQGINQGKMQGMRGVPSPDAAGGFMPGQMQPPPGMAPSAPPMGAAPMGGRPMGGMPPGIGRAPGLNGALPPGLGGGIPPGLAKRGMEAPPGFPPGGPQPPMEGQPPIPPGGPKFSLPGANAGPDIQAQMAPMGNPLRRANMPQQAPNPQQNRGALARALALRMGYGK